MASARAEFDRYAEKIIASDASAARSHNTATMTMPCSDDGAALRPTVCLVMSHPASVPRRRSCHHPRDWSRAAVRHDGYADIDIGTAGAQPRGTVLWQSPLRDVEVCDDLNAGDDGLWEHAHRGVDLPEQSIDTHGVPQDFILAYKWLNLAAARASKREREYFVRLRNAVASKMSTDQIVVGQRLALLWAPGQP